MIHIACIHGVNHGVDEQQVFADEWAAILRSHGMEVTCHPLAWSSTASAIADWLATWGKPGTFEEHLAEIEVGLHMRAGLLEWERFTRGEPRVLLGHSWGTVLGYNLVNRYPYLDSVPLLGLGTPYTHGWLGRRLRWAGRAPDWARGGRRPVFVVNRDDGITTGRGLGMRFNVPAPRGSKTVWVQAEVPPMPWPGEHDVGLYLDSPDVRQLIEAAAPPVIS